MTAIAASKPAAAPPPITMSPCDMTRIGPLFTVRSVPVRIYANGIGYEVVGLTLANTRAAAQHEAARANAARGMERTLRRIAEMSAWADGGAASLAKLVADIGKEAREGLAMLEQG